MKGGLQIQGSYKIDTTCLLRLRTCKYLLDVRIAITPSEILQHVSSAQTECFDFRFQAIWVASKENICKIYYTFS